MLLDYVAETITYKTVVLPNSNQLIPLLYFLCAPYDENRKIVRSDEDFPSYNKYLLSIPCHVPRAT
jgi:hypothetical protein